VTGSYDVFLCYKWEDQVAAENLRAALDSRGLTVFRDEIGLNDWDPLAEKIEQALRDSRTLVALVTPKFPISPHCRQELHTALAASYYLDDGATQRVLAIIQDISPDHLRPDELGRLRMPRDGKPTDELANEIARMARQVDDRVFGDAPTPPPPRWFPFELARDTYFRGRAAELWELHAALRTREKLHDPGPPIACVQASGGEGKTALCLQYARLFARDHPGGVYLIRLGGSDGRSAGGDAAVRSIYLSALREIATTLGLQIPDHPDGPLLALRQRLEDDETPYLWIVDDVPSSAGHLVDWLSAPTRSGKTLITTRGRFGPAEIELRPLDTVAARAILTAYRPPVDRPGLAAAGEIVDLLGHHPLGLTLAAGLTTTQGFVDYPDLLADLSSVTPDYLEAAAQLGDGVSSRCVRPFTRTLIRSFDSLDGLAQDLLGAASVLGPTPVPISLIAAMLTTDGEPPPDLAAALTRTARHGLITAVGESTILMHALTARAIRIHLGPAGGRDRMRDRALAVLISVVEASQGVDSLQELLAHLPHVRAVVGLMAGGDRRIMTADDRHLVNETGRVQVEYGETNAAVDSFEALYMACVASSEVDVITRLSVLLGWATTLGLAGQTSRALELKQQVVDGMGAELGWETPEPWTALNNLGISYYDAKDYRTAYQHLRRVYVWRRDELGASDRETLMALSNLAIVQGHLGDGSSAARHHGHVAHRLWAAAAGRWVQVARPDDPAIADVRQGLALSYRRLGQLAEALELEQQVYAARSARFGEHHPDTLDALENILILREEINAAGHLPGSVPAQDGQTGA
jgi:hypothetical protein